MSGISSVGSYSAYSPYSMISSGGFFNKAKDGASELAIQEKTKSQVNGLDAGKENLTSAKSALNVEDGAMSGIQDYLQSIKELAVKSQNATLSDSDKQSIQNQIDQYKQGINDIAGNTTFNEKNLLNNDGKLSVAADGNESTSEVPTFNSATEALGIADLDVTGDFDMKSIDDAIEKVSSQRSTVGASTNAIESAMTYNSHAALELNGYQMDKEEDNVIKANQELKTKQALDSYQAVLQRQKQENEQQRTMTLFA